MPIDTKTISQLDDGGQAQNGDLFEIERGGQSFKATLNTYTKEEIRTLIGALVVNDSATLTIDSPRTIFITNTVANINIILPIIPVGEKTMFNVKNDSDNYTATVSAIDGKLISGNLTAVVETSRSDTFIFDGTNWI